MKKPNHFFLLIMLFISNAILAQNEPFVMAELNQRPALPSQRYRLGHPFEIIYGPDNYLYITEKVGRILRVDTGTGIRQVILDIRSQVALTISRNGVGQATSIGQDGMMGMELHPEFNTGTNKDSIFVAFKHTSGSIRIVRYKFNGGANPSLSGETVLITGIPAGSDHSSGRMIIGADNKIYYTCGDLGSNQFAARCNTIRSQSLPTAIQVSSGNYSMYAGKILRINFDGSIPSDNPVLSNGVKSHVYTIGHRNPQGLVWQFAPANGNAYPVKLAGGKLFSSEHGPRTDDEINLIEAGRNYGWPNIAGSQDNINYTYVNWSSAGSNCSTTTYSENAIPAGATVLQESDAPASITANFREPLLNIFTDCGTNPLSKCNAGGTDWMKFATIAPSSIDYYHVNGGKGIPGWYPSLLLPTLRRGTLYRVRLNALQDGMTTDTIAYFTTNNRYRDMAISSDGSKIFVITDSIGSTSGPSGTGTSTLANRGSILAFTYAGTSLLNHVNTPIISDPGKNFSIYPNPARHVVFIDVPQEMVRKCRFQLMDMIGNILIASPVEGTKTTIDVSIYKRGIYFLRVVDQRGLERKVQKVVLH